MNNNTNWVGDLVAKVLTSGGVPEKKHSMHVGHVLEMSSTAATKNWQEEVNGEFSSCLKLCIPLV